MSRIVIFGITNLDFEGLDDPSVKVYLVGTDYDYEDENIKSVSNKNILDFYIEEDLENVDEPVMFIDCTGASKNYIDVNYENSNDIVCPLCRNDNLEYFTKYH